jgi:aspartate racemase
MAKVLGILGGMGPMSTVDLMRKVTEKTPVKKEQEHLRMLVDSRPQIPDRTAAILGKGPSPAPMLQESARLLERWGAELLAIPCNSAHAFLPDVRDAVAVEVLDMIGLVGRELGRRFPPGSPVALLATTGSRPVNSGIRPNSIRSVGFTRAFSRSRIVRSSSPEVERSSIQSSVLAASTMTSSVHLMTSAAVRTPPPVNPRMQNSD